MSRLIDEADFRKSANPDLAFLAGRQVVYYAGLDDIALPFGELLRVMPASPERHAVYLKALSLVVDHVVIPPSFYFPWVAPDSIPSRLPSLLAPLYGAGHLLSPVYSGMTSPTDFVDLKLSAGPARQAQLVKERRKNLKALFREMPLKCRNVEMQSARFEAVLASKVSKTGQRPWMREVLSASVEASSRIVGPRLVLTRASILETLDEMLGSGAITTRQYRQFHALMNSTYYVEGAATHFADVSCLGADRLAVFGPEPFLGAERRILIAYDPEVVLSILSAHGVTDKHLGALSDQEISSLKNTHEFRRFRDRYRDFANEFQRCLTAIRRPSRSALRHLKARILEEFCREGLKGRDRAKAQSFWWNTAESGLFALATGTLGLLLIPLYGALLGALPPIVHAFRLTPRASDYVLRRIAGADRAFYDYAEALRALAERMERHNRALHDNDGYRAVE